MQYKPDILVVQECEYGERLKFEAHLPQPNDFLWFGENRHKGIGVFSFGPQKLGLLPIHNQALKFILPIAVSGGAVDFTLFAIWANNPADPDGRYVAQVWKAVQEYEQLLATNNCVLTGDFNSNSIWDRPRRIGNHSDVTQKLANYQIHSIYHRFFGEQQGKELQPTFYLHRNLNKPYHMDFCYMTSELCDTVNRVEVGIHSDWATVSDHMPIIVDIDV